MSLSNRLALTLVLLGSLAAILPAADDVVSARQLATSGKRPEALALLTRRLATLEDDDARTLRGIVLSWEGRYAEARLDLEAVLSRHRDHGDALPALINVEMWSDHPDRAEALARDALRRNPNDTTLLLARAKALRALDRQREASAIVRHLLDVDPGNTDAIRQERALGSSAPRWSASFDHASEWFSDKREPWREEQFQLGYQTRFGSIIGRASQASRFASVSRQMELDLYPHLRSGTYAYLNAGWSPDSNLYPRYRIGAELYQSLGKGWEGSAGFRQLHFGGNVRIYTPSLTRYYGNWMFTGRLYLTPGSTGTSRSVQIGARHYSGDGQDYWGLRYGHGSSPAETSGIYEAEILDASTLSLEFRRTLHGRLVLQGRWGFSCEDRIATSGLRHYLAEASLGYLF